jgi:hypothetical protein
MEWPEAADDLGFHTLRWPLHEVAIITSRNAGKFDSRHWEQQLQTRKSQVWIRFDVADHLDHQLTDAEEILRQLSTSVPSHRRRDPQKLLDYLRVHDARTAKIAYAEIAAALYPELPDDYPSHEGRDRVRKDFRTANDLISSGFLNLRIKERNVSHPA